jgi:hypothetical protein
LDSRGNINIAPLKRKYKNTHVVNAPLPLLKNCEKNAAKATSENMGMIETLYALNPSSNP